MAQCGASSELLASTESAASFVCTDDACAGGCSATLLRARARAVRSCKLRFCFRAPSILFRACSSSSSNSFSRCSLSLLKPSKATPTVPLDPTAGASMIFAPTRACHCFSILRRSPKPAASGTAISEASHARNSSAETTPSPSVSARAKAARAPISCLWASSSWRCRLASSAAA